MSLLVIAENCRLCDRPASPAGMVSFQSVKTSTGPWRICAKCYEWHQDALLVLAGQKVPKGCATCGRTMDQIATAAIARQLSLPQAVQLSPARGEVEGRKMFAHAIDGVYALLCPRCSERVEQLQRFAYKDTPYGQRKGLL